ncbi:MAG: anthranilate synthase component 1 [Aestuariibacter sp.]
MSLAQLGEQPGKLISVVSDCDYVADPLAAYYTLCGEQHHNLLLESAEIDSKNSVNSLILVDAALKITCRGQQVVCEALSDNGTGINAVLQSHLSDSLVSDKNNSTKATFKFAIPDPHLDEDNRLKARSVFDVLRTIQQQFKVYGEHPQALFLGGTFAYDLLATFEQLPQVAEGVNHCPDYVFYVAETLLLIDHQDETTTLLASVFSGENVPTEFFRISQRVEEIRQSLQNLRTLPTIATKVRDDEIKVDKSDAQFCQDVIDLKEHILAGDIFQVVPSRTFSVPCPNSFQAYATLKKTNPSPYMFYIRDSSFTIFGASPESALKYEKQNNQVEVYPIAGTRPRGKNADGGIAPDLDSRIELSLREDEKEKSEHLMLVDLARNDIARVAIPGSRYVRDLLKVDRYSHVMHLVSRVVGQLREDLDCLHAYQACMNMGTLVGAPKVSAASLIRHTEQKRRGSYGGAVGYINGKGDMDTCIVIRSAFVCDDIAHIQAGAGVVHDSIPQSEADETRNKAQAVISAIVQAHQETSL